MAATAFVRGGFWPENGVTTMTQASGEHTDRLNIGRTLGHRGMLSLRIRMWRLSGAAPGANAWETQYHVSSSEELGGKRPIVASTVINRSTTAADVTEIEQMLWFSDRTHLLNSPPNLDRNPLGDR